MGTAANCRDCIERLADAALVLIFATVLPALPCTAVTRLAAGSCFDGVVAMTGMDNTPPTKAAAITEMNRWVREEATEIEVKFKRMTSFLTVFNSNSVPSVIK